MKVACLLFALLSLTGCQGFTKWAYKTGDHFPVVGERCEHWECMSESGRIASEKMRAEKEILAEEGTPVEEEKEEAASDPKPFPTSGK
jgi:hypothetical protein